jgi:hypothetical protein
MYSGSIEEQRKKNAEQMRSYRARHREQMQAYDRERYRKVKADRERQERMGDKHCRLCQIRLAGRYGAYGTREYCRGCRDSGDAKRHAAMLATRRWRENQYVS